MVILCHANLKEKVRVRGRNMAVSTVDLGRSQLVYLNANEMDACVSAKIKKIMDEGKYPQNQAVAMAYSYCEKGEG